MTDEIEQLRQRVRDAEADLQSAKQRADAAAADHVEVAARVRGLRARLEAAESDPQYGEDVPALLETTGRVVRVLRETAGWSQVALADAMNRAGFSWSRTTVLEVERGSRRIQVDELIMVAALFAVPVAGILAPATIVKPGFTTLGDGDHAITVPLRDVADVVSGTSADWGPHWEAARRVAGVIDDEDYRPASDYWRAVAEVPDDEQG